MGYSNINRYLYIDSHYCFFEPVITNVCNLHYLLHMMEMQSGSEIFLQLEKMFLEKMIREHTAYYRQQ